MDNRFNVQGFSKDNNPFNSTERNLAVCIVLSLVTCGIFLYYWMYKMNEEAYMKAQMPMFTDGVKLIVFTIITCGIYGIIWSYKTADVYDKIKNNQPGTSRVLFTLLAVFGLQIVVLALLQNSLNENR